MLMTGPDIERSFGLGLRKPHYSDFLDGDVRVDFVEVISENFMVDGGKPKHILERVRERYPVALHGVAMSLGSSDGLDRAYLARLRKLVDEIDPVFVSDHLSWSRFGEFNSHDLLPLPYTEETLNVVAANLRVAQDMLGRQMLVENPSSYVTFDGSTLSEAAFLAELCTLTDCGLLLDVNNVYVSATNHGFDAATYLGEIPQDRVSQIHLAGHSAGHELLIDTHDRPVPHCVWTLYERAITRFGPVATMIERDDDIPKLEDLLIEVDVARVISNLAETHALCF